VYIRSISRLPSHIRLVPINFEWHRGDIPELEERGKAELAEELDELINT
jgi:hypothetical protein